MYSATDIIHAAAEAPFPRLMPDEVARLPRELAERLVAAGILRPGEIAPAISCMACEADHVEWVEKEAGPDGRTRYFIPCPEEGRVEVAPARLQCWTVDFTPIAEALGAGLGAIGPVETVRPGRLWRLGAARLAGRPRELWMARDACSVRGPDILAAIPRSRRPVLFRLGGEPLERAAAADFDAVFDVRTVLDLTEAGIKVHREAVEARLAKWTRPARPAHPRAEPVRRAESARLFASA
jgi:hypothetical protein